MSNISGLSAVLKMKCPRCRKGNLFQYPTSYNYTKVFQMPVHCTVCGQRTEPEPGFYFGGMYINYAFSVVILVLSFAILYGVYKLSAVYVIGSYVGVLFLLGPWLFRYSRVVYLSIFVSYDEGYEQKSE